MHQVDGSVDFPHGETIGFLEHHQGTIAAILGFRLEGYPIIDGALQVSNIPWEPLFSFNFEGLL